MTPVREDVRGILADEALKCVECSDGTWRTRAERDTFQRGTAQAPEFGRTEVLWGLTWI